MNQKLSDPPTGCVESRRAARPADEPPRGPLHRVPADTVVGEGYLVQMIEARSLRVEHYAIVATAAEALELGDALGQRFPDRLVDVVDLRRVRKASTND